MKSVFLKGLSGGYVDFLICAGDKILKELSRKAYARFAISEDQTSHCSFNVFTCGVARIVR